MHLLPALAAGLVRCIHIDRFDKLSEGIGGQFREGAVPLYPLNKLLYTRSKTAFTAALPSSVSRLSSGASRQSKREYGKSFAASAAEFLRCSSPVDELTKNVQWVSPF